MKTWIFEEYLSLPVILFEMYRANMRRKADIARRRIQYGSDRYQYVLVFRPLRTAMPCKHTVFFIHGGGWAAGSAEGFAFVGDFFAEQGFNVILSGYRHAPKFKYPAQLEDIYKGLSTGIKALEAQGHNTGKIIAAGQSAGAHLAALIALDDANARKHEMDTGIFSAMILISGPLDFSVCNAKQINLGLHGLLSSKEDYAAADPIRLVPGQRGVPILCIHGRKDPIVDIKNSTAFYNSMEPDPAGPSRLVIAENKHHIDLLRLFMRDTEETTAVKEFINKIEKM